MHASDTEMATTATTAELSRPVRVSNKSEIPCRFYARGEYTSYAGNIKARLTRCLTGLCRHGDEVRESALEASPSTGDRASGRRTLSKD